MRRLSSNWLVNKFAAAYVGVIRNTPLFLQLMFWYFGVIIQLPAVRQAIKLPGPIFLTQRGIYFPWAEPTATTPAWRGYILICNYFHLSLFGSLRVPRKNVLPVPLSPWWNLAYLFNPYIHHLAWGDCIQPEPPLKPFMPELTGLNFKGGLRLTPEFAALLFGLVVYTGAFIAEIVRAGIQAVSKGQVEAARSLGLIDRPDTSIDRFSASVAHHGATGH